MDPQTTNHYVGREERQKTGEKGKQGHSGENTGFNPAARVPPLRSAGELGAAEGHELPTGLARPSRLACRGERLGETGMGTGPSGRGLVLVINK